MCKKILILMHTFDIPVILLFKCSSFYCIAEYDMIVCNCETFIIIIIIINRLLYVNRQVW